MSEKDVGNGLKRCFLIKNQRNQAIGWDLLRLLPCQRWKGTESTMQLARCFRD